MTYVALRQGEACAVDQRSTRHGSFLLSAAEGVKGLFRAHPVRPRRLTDADKLAAASREILRLRRHIEALGSQCERARNERDTMGEAMMAALGLAEAATGRAERAERIVHGLISEADHEPDVRLVFAMAAGL